MSETDALLKKREAELLALLAQGPPTRGTAAAPITWIFEPESFRPIAKLLGAEHLSITTDTLGAPLVMTDARGQAVWSASIDTHGSLHHLKGSPHACPFRFQGQYEDAETGLHYNGHRYYDPHAGRYISQDPIGLAGGTALYAYCANPLGWADPLGLCGSEAAQGTGTSPTITADELSGRTRTDLAQMASRKGLVPHGQPDPISGSPRKWKDPVSGEQRLRLDRGHTDPRTGQPYNDPRAAVDHAHGYEADGVTKIRPPGGNPHFPTTGE